MLVGALSSCHMLWFVALASKEGFEVASYEDDAEGGARRRALHLRDPAAAGRAGRARRPTPRPIERAPPPARTSAASSPNSVNFPVEVRARSERPAARRRQGPRPDPPAAGRLLLAAARRPRRRGAQGRGHRHGRLHPLGAALLRRRRQQELGTRSSLYLSLNRGKRSVRLDLKCEAGREALLRLVERHDVVLDGFRPGVLDRLGVGYERMREANPAIVFCAITGYGQDGPYAQRAGHDMNYLGLVGLLGLTGAKDGPPVQSAGQIADLGGGGLMAAFGVMAALHERRRSGEGQMVDVSMADGALSWLAMVAGRYFCDGEVPRRGEQQLAGGLVCYLPYEAADGWVTCGALEPKFWAAFCNGRRAPRPDREAVRGARLRRLARGGRGLPRPRPATSGSPSTTSTTAASSRSSTSTRRSTRSWSGRARWSSSWSSRARHGPPARRPGEAEPHPRRPDPAGARLRRAHRRGAARGRLLRRGDRGDDGVRRRRRARERRRRRADGPFRA